MSSGTPFAAVPCVLGSYEGVSGLSVAAFLWETALMPSLQADKDTALLLGTLRCGLTCKQICEPCRRGRPRGLAAQHQGPATWETAW